ncbi:MAG: M20 family peptidase [Comamonadaceae bacterium]|nr:MAG: M20 family peptidase [Comamonadaceae bacterium]
MPSDDVKAGVEREFGKHLTTVTALSHDIALNPELSFEEFRTSAALVATLERAGYEIEREAGGLATAFVATAGTGSLVVAICAEMDALPVIGHGCGHNTIAASAAGAALALVSFVDDLDLTLKIIGTPAEERGGAKTSMIEAGVFDGIHASMMVHPTLKDMVTPIIRAARQYTVTYLGRSAHASRPYSGLNAGDAATITQVSIGLLRQQLRDRDRVHAIVREAGDAVNVIPERAVMDFMVRADTLTEVELIWRRVKNCIDAGALAASVDVNVDGPTMEVNGFRHDPMLASLFQSNAEALGRTFPDYDDKMLGSTDMSDVSVRMPAIHPVLSYALPPESGNHTAAFAEASGAQDGDRFIADGGLAMALTVVDAALSPSTREHLFQCFENDN